MENCPLPDVISLYLDGELDPASSSWIETHLETCARCRKAAEDLERAGDILRLVSAAGSPPPSRLDRLIGERLSGFSGEEFLGVIELEMPPPGRSAGVRSGPELARVAEREAAYRTGRGGDEGGFRFLAGTEVKVRVEIARTAEGGVTGWIEVRDRADRPREGVRLRLERGGEMIRSSCTGARGESVIPGLSPGRYRLLLEDLRTCSLILMIR